MAERREVCEKCVRKGQPVWKAVRWCVSLAAAFDLILRRKVRHSDAKTLLELKEVILKAQAELMEVWTLDRFDDLHPKAA